MTEFSEGLLQFTPLVAFGRVGTEERRHRVVETPDPGIRGVSLSSDVLHLVKIVFIFNVTYVRQWHKRKKYLKVEGVTVVYLQSDRSKHDPVNSVTCSIKSNWISFSDLVVNFS